MVTPVHTRDASYAEELQLSHSVRALYLQRIFQHDGDLDNMISFGWEAESGCPEAATRGDSSGHKPQQRYPMYPTKTHDGSFTSNES